jgi:hypothetical protein
VAAKEVLHVVWSNTIGPIVAYRNPEMAWAHARSILGVDVGSCEVRATLPEVVKIDLDTAAQAEFEEDQVTPVNDVNHGDEG